jgi:hypothetical protein
VSRDELMFTTGFLVGALTFLLVGLVTIPWWISLITVPLALRLLWRLAVGWRDRWREIDARLREEL